MTDRMDYAVRVIDRLPPYQQDELADRLLAEVDPMLEADRMVLARQDEAAARVRASLGPPPCERG